MAQQGALEYLTHGQAPFFRLPSAPALDLPPTARAVFLGVPSDAGTTYQPGARFGPFHVRRVSALVQGWHRGHGVAPFLATGAVDGGNVVFPPFDRVAGRAAIQRAVALALRQGATPFLVGGDHSLTHPALRAVADRCGPVALVHVDAHLDTSGPEVWGEAHHHGTPIRHAIEEGLVAPGRLWQIGIRGPWGGASDAEVAADHGGRIVDADELARRGPEDVAKEICATVGDRPLYLTFDVDAVDPAFAPGTGTPVPGGLSAREALALVRGLAGARLAGMDLVEVAPALDHADVTAHLAAHLLFEGLAIAALRIDGSGARAG
jgi:agmatinase